MTSDPTTTLASRVSDLEIKVVMHDKTLERHELAISSVRENQHAMTTKLALIQARLDETATKSDVEACVSKGINGILHDALNAIPEKDAARIGRQNLFWSIIMALAGVAGLAWSLYHG